MNDEKKDFEAYLHRYDMKSTKARNEVLRILIARAGVVTPDDMHQQLAARGVKINVSTIYRILELFTTKGLTIKTYLPDIRKYGFSLRSMGHRHRLICLACHQIVDIGHCPLQPFELALAQQTQFEIVGHQLEIYGYCPKCQKKMEAKKDGESSCP